MRKTIGVSLMLLCFIFTASVNFDYLQAKKKAWKIIISLERVIIESHPPHNHCPKGNAKEFGLSPGLCGSHT
jgi:hypothetical protein